MTSIQTVETVVVLLVNLNTGINGMRLLFQIAETDILLSKKNVRLLILILSQLNFATRLVK